MDFLIAAILGVIQGLTKFLPVSSSGCLVILERLTGFQPPVPAFHVFLHAGTAIAVCLVMSRDIAGAAGDAAAMASDLAGELNQSLKSGGSLPLRSRIICTDSRKRSSMLITAALSACLTGVLLSGPVAYTSRSALFSGAGMLVTGILLLVTDMVRPQEKSPSDLGAGSAVVIGAALGIAALPGISGTALVICACILAGMSRKFSVRFSCLLSVPVTAAALVYSTAAALRQGQLSLPMLGCCLLGMAASCIVGRFMIRICLVRLKRGKFSSYAYFCFAAGFAAVLLSF